MSENKAQCHAVDSCDEESCEVVLRLSVDASIFPVTSH